MTENETVTVPVETRGGEEPFDWKVSPDAISEAQDRGEGE